MDIIRAPWRMAYIGSDEKITDCIFCVYPQEDNDAENLILHRGNYAFVMLNRYPYATGHLLVIPYRHTSDLTTLTVEEGAEMLELTQKSIQAIEVASKPHGYNLGMNLGKTAGAGIDAHLHLHIVPRWDGDTNFMSVTAETKVLPEALSATREKLLSVWPKNA